VTRRRKPDASDPDERGAAIDWSRVAALFAALLATAVRRRSSSKTAPHQADAAEVDREK
jgi:hypothetical protein